MYIYIYIYTINPTLRLETSSTIPQITMFVGAMNQSPVMVGLWRPGFPTLLRPRNMEESKAHGRLVSPI